MLLPSEGASFCEPCFSSCRLTENSGASNTQNYRLCVAEDGGDFIASWAFYIHEVGIGALHQALLLVFPLLLFRRGMEEILSERHIVVGRSSPPERSESGSPSPYIRHPAGSDASVFGGHVGKVRLSALSACHLQVTPPLRQPLTFLVPFFSSLQIHRNPSLFPSQLLFSPIHLELLTHSILPVFPLPEHLSPNSASLFLSHGVSDSIPFPPYHLLLSFLAP